MNTQAIKPLKGPNGENLPLPYRWVVAHQIYKLTPWFIWNESQNNCDAVRRQFKNEAAAPNPSVIKDFWPVAMRQDCDEWAGFIIEDGRITDKILQVHLCFPNNCPADSGYPLQQSYEDFWEWFKLRVIQDTIEWQDADELPFIIEELFD